MVEEPDVLEVEVGLRADPDALLNVADQDMEARLRARLFEGSAAPTKVGPFEVLERIGAGGMGEVFAAIDPRLQRRVALKLIRTCGAQARADVERRLRREARALAQLDHPNIVRVFDVGVHETKLYMAMELVDGRTLRRWLKERTRHWTEILPIFDAAGQALAAAHAAGLVHRDFKPDNVVIDSEERVRVLDFGLALAFRVPATDDSAGQDEAATASAEHPPSADPPRDTGDAASGSGDAPPCASGSVYAKSVVDSGRQSSVQTRNVVGTVGYMAPEQYLRLDPSPATDQFAFCVSLYEALYGKEPLPRGSFNEARDATVRGSISPPAPGDVPAWIGRVVMRGLAVEPARRWPSMADLLAELSHGRARRRRLGWGVLAGALTLGGLVLALSPTERLSGCASSDTLVAAQWGPARQEGIAERFAEVGDYGTTVWEQLQPAIEARVAALASQHHDACVATRSDDLMADRRLACVGEQRAGLGAALTVLDAADPHVVTRAHEILSGLNEVGVCQDDAYIQRRSEFAAAYDAAKLTDLRHRLATLRPRVVVGQPRETDETSARLLRDAEAFGHPGVYAAALVLRGRHELGAGRAQEAGAVFEQAYFLGLSVDPDLAALAAMYRVTVAHETGQDLETGLAWGRHARAASGVDGLTARDESRLLIEQAHLYRTRGRPIEAAALVRGAIDVLRRAGDTTSLSLGRAHNALAAALSNAGDYESAGEHHRIALRLFTQGLGPKHPVTAGAIANYGVLLLRTGDYKEAEAQFRDANTIRAALLRDDHPKVLGGMINLGTALHEQGRSDEAIAVLVDVVERVGDGPYTEHKNFGWVLNNLGILLVDSDSEADQAEGQAYLARAQITFERFFGPDHPRVAGVVNNLGLQALKRGQNTLAKAKFDRALAIYREAYGPEHNEVANIIANQAKLAVAQARLDDALRLADEALRMRNKVLSPDHPDIAGSAVVVAQVRAAREEFGHARAVLDEADAVYDLKLPRDHPKRSESRELRAELDGLGLVQDAAQ